MAHFFVPTHADKGHGAMAADGAAISDLVVDTGGTATFGLYGGGWDGERLLIKVYRGSVVVNEGAAASVKLNRLSDDSVGHIQVYSASGLRNGDEIYGMLANGGRFTGALTVRQLKDAGGIIELWAKALADEKPFSNPYIYPNGVPYLALADAKQGKMTKLDTKCFGGPLRSVHGLAIHATSGTDARTPYQMARYGCVETWNRVRASTHFGIAGNGTVIQFLPTSLTAFAQGSPGNSHWLSTEVDNDGHSPMNVMQLTAAKRLFAWICARYGVPNRVAAGCLFKNAPQFDEITMTVCGSANQSVTTDTFGAVMSRGVSCHWWLEPNKSSRSHACPGKDIIGQLSTIANSGLVSV